MGVGGVVRAFVCTDVEGSTRLWASDPEAMSVSLELHDEIVRSALNSRGGTVFTTAGDSFWAAFERPRDAVAALAEVQLRLGEASWPGPTLRVRAGVHVGEAESRADDWFGPTLNFTARLASAGHGGQVLVSEAVQAMVDAELRDLGSHVLKDIDGPVRIFQLGDADFPALRSGGRTNLPATPNRLLGRDDDVRRVRVLLTEARLVTLVAIGGTGKTRLALEVAEAERGQWPDGVWFVDLTVVAPGDSLATAVADAIRLAVSGTDDVETLVVEHLAERAALVVLDNCEHVVDEVAAFAERVLAAGGKSKLLATARELLDVDGERPVQVAPLAVDGPDSPAVRLFVERALVAADDFAADDHLGDIVEVCRHLDGIPLAIELAASRVGVLSPAKLLDSLQDRFRLLSGSRRRNRHRTLRAAIDWSYESLDADHQAAFRALAVFSGTFDIDAVADITGNDLLDAADIVEALLHRSLVTPSDERDRFRLLETIRAYAEDRLVEAAEAAEVRRRHAEHFWARNHPTTRLGAASARRTMELLADRPNLLEALGWYEQHERWDDLPQFLFGLANLGFTDTTRVLDAVERCRAHLDDASLEHFLDLAELELTMIMGMHREDILLRHLAVLERLQQSDVLWAAAFAHCWAGFILAAGNPTQGEAEIQRGAEIAASAGDQRFLDQAVPAFRLLASCMGSDLDAAVDHARDVRAGGDVLDLARNAYTCLLLVELIDGWRRGDEATTARSAEEYARVSGDGATNDFLLSFCRFVHLLTAGEQERATAELRALTAFAAEGRLAMIEGDALLALALAEHDLGDDDRARSLLEDVRYTRTPPTGALASLLRTRLNTVPAPNSDPRMRLKQEIAARGWSR